MIHGWKALSLLLPAALLTAAPARAAPVPKRIVSLNLCADQLLLRLADRRQIAALTRLAADPSMSYEAARAGGIPITRGTAEEVMVLAPDLLIGSATKRGQIARLTGRSIAGLDLAPAESLEAIVAQVHLVAEAVGHPQRGAELVRQMRQELAALRRPRTGGVAAVYQRRGYLTGTGTLADEALRRAGLTNLAARLGRPPLSQISLEQLVAARPDYLVMVDDEPAADRGMQLMRHPAIAGVPRLSLPRAAMVCGGPGFVDAVKSLTLQVRRAERGLPRAGALR